MTLLTLLVLSQFFFRESLWNYYCCLHKRRKIYAHSRRKREIVTCLKCDVFFVLRICQILACCHIFKDDNEWVRNLLEAQEEKNSANLISNTKQEEEIWFLWKLQKEKKMVFEFLNPLRFRYSKIMFTLEGCIS